MIVESGVVEEPMSPDLDRWIGAAALRIEHRRSSNADPDRLWQAAREVRLSDAARLGRLIRWRIPGTTAEQSFEELFTSPPFVVLERADHALVTGIVGRIWTIRRDYPELTEPDQFRDWSAPGTARVVFANWAERGNGGGATLTAETRVEPFGVQGRVGVAMVRPLVAAFHELIGSEAIEAAVRRAES
jgi:hypothetical protein